MSKETNLVRFLLVEDDDDHAEVVRRTLSRERLNNEIDHVRNGAEALALLRGEGGYREHPLPDIILLDLKMPVMDGHEVLAVLKKDARLRRIPVVIMTTSDAESDRERAYDLNANSYVVKPVDFERFRQLVRDLSLYWGVWHRGSAAGD